MSYCAPICNTPCGVGYRNSCSLVPYFGGIGSCGYGAGSLFGVGGNVACTSQLPGSEVVIQPPPSVVSIPGPILSATPDPVAVGQYTPCSTGYPSLGSSGSAVGCYGGSYGSYGRGLGYGGWRRYSRRCRPFYSSGYGSCDPCGPC